MHFNQFKFIDNKTLKNVIHRLNVNFVRNKIAVAQKLIRSKIGICFTWKMKLIQITNLRLSDDCRLNRRDRNRYAEGRGLLFVVSVKKFSWKIFKH